MGDPCVVTEARQCFCAVWKGQVCAWCPSPAGLLLPQVHLQGTCGLCHLPAVASGQCPVSVLTHPIPRHTGKGLGTGQHTLRAHLGASVGWKGQDSFRSGEVVSCGLLAASQLFPRLWLMWNVAQQLPGQAEGCQGRFLSCSVLIRGGKQRAGVAVLQPRLSSGAVPCSCQVSL